MCRSDSVHSIFYNGSDHKLILISHEHLSHPFSLTLFEHSIYWTDWRYNTLVKVRTCPSLWLTRSIWQSENWLAGLVVNCLLGGKGVGSGGMGRDELVPAKWYCLYCNLWDYLLAAKWECPAPVVRNRIYNSYIYGTLSRKNLECLWKHKDMLILSHTRIHHTHHTHSLSLSLSHTHTHTHTHATNTCICMW